MKNKTLLLVAVILALGSLALLLGLLGPGVVSAKSAYAQATNGQHCQFHAITVTGGMGVITSDTLPGGDESRTIYFSKRGSGMITITVVLTDLHATDPSYVWASPAFGRSEYLESVVTRTNPSAVFTYSVPSTETSARVILTSSHYITGSMYVGLYQTRTLSFVRRETCYLPLILNNYPFVQLVNGSFEVGLSGWEKIESPLPVTVVEEIPEDSTAIADREKAVRMSTSYSSNDVPLGYAAITQTFNVPANATRLTFKYIIWTEDYSKDENHDRFEIYIDGDVVFRDGNEENDLAPGRWYRVPGLDNQRSSTTTGDPATGWAIGVVDLTAYRGKLIALSFQNHSRFDNWYNTYTYLDDIRVE